MSGRPIKRTLRRPAVCVLDVDVGPRVDQQAHDFRVTILDRPYERSSIVGIDIIQRRHSIRQSLTLSVWPSVAATTMAGVPASSFDEGSAPLSRRSCTASTRPRCNAMMSAVEGFGAFGRQHLDRVVVSVRRCLHQICVDVPTAAKQQWRQDQSKPASQESWHRSVPFVFKCTSTKIHVATTAALNRTGFPGELIS